MGRTVRSLLAMLGLLALYGGLPGCASVAPLAPAATVAPRAAAPAPDAQLTPDAALAIALDHDPALRAARHRVSSAYWLKVQASLPANPSLGGTLDPGEWVARLSAGIVDLLDLGGRRRAAVRAGQAREEQAALAVLQRRIEVVRAVRTEVAAVQVGARAARLYAARVELLGEVVTVARGQRELGELAALDVLHLERRLAEAEMARDDHALAQRQAAARLNRWLGRPPAADLALAPSDERPALALPDAPDVDLGLLRRPELAVLAARAREQRARLAIARVAWLPDLEAGPYLKRGDGPTVGGGHATLAVPLFDRGRAQRGAAHGALAALEEEMLAVQADILLEIHQALLRLRRAQRRADIQQPAVRHRAQAAHDLLREASLLGASSAIDVSLARLEVLDTDLAAAADELAVRLAHADLAAALGDGGDEQSPVALAPRREGRRDGQD